MIILLLNIHILGFNTYNFYFSMIMCAGDNLKAIPDWQNRVRETEERKATLLTFHEALGHPRKDLVEIILLYQQEHEVPQ